LSLTPSTNVSALQSPLVDPTTVTWSIGDLFAAAPDNEASLDIEMKVNAEVDVADGTDVVNSAQITAPFVGDIVSESLGIGGANLAVNIFYSDSIDILDGYIYVDTTIIVSNLGVETATNVKLQAQFKNLDVFPYSNAGCQIIPAVGTEEFDSCIFYSIGNLLPGAEVKEIITGKYSFGGSNVFIRHNAWVGSGKVYNFNDADADEPGDFTVLDPNLLNNYSIAGTELFIPGGQGSSSSGGKCFIATAAYGSYMEPEVLLLRQFRDHYLLTNWPGRQLVRAYYATSPPLANVIAQHDSLRAISRAMLAPLIYTIKYPLGALAIFLLLGYLIFRWVRFRKYNDCVVQC